MLVPEKYGYSRLSLNRLLVSCHFVSLSKFLFLFLAFLRPRLLIPSVVFIRSSGTFVSLGLLTGTIPVVGYRRDGPGGDPSYC